MKEPIPSTRLYSIVARDAPVAVVFRRGPTRQVEVLRWDLRSDRVTAGQWLKGRIYERRCDLSPGGRLTHLLRGQVRDAAQILDPYGGSG